ncbi:cytochrome ubiquinol oxidase subunit I [Methylohalobius crimeensis]|uniref:cytochrome ubiquinol oxidase subunit I n=1 Tax=Methylohalobius crimeensis TaxID=244365 RepID=UPI00041E0863|nr:cytochrome ubiquinol oxidase subunit I [Methylohalobius crimeensis]
MPDPLILARIQFAFTVSFHIVFPAFTIGLASYLAVLEGLWLATKRDVFLQVYRYWLIVFALAFAMGVVSGLVMSYQFGTNWGPFSEKTGPILGPLLAYEVLSAFFLEAGFLGVMLFGLDRVGPKLHFAATLLVAFGTLLSAFWILSANSWMHTPAGFRIDEGRYVPDNWLEVIFNPSFPYRFGHMVLAAYLTTAFAVGATGAWHLLGNKAGMPARVMFAMAVSMAVVVAPVQLIVGDLHGLNTLTHQPAKVAAMEGHFETHAGAPLILFGIPDMEEAETKYKIGIPKLASLILKHDFDAEVTGLDAFPREAWPNVPIVFWAFRIMVGLGMLMILFGIVGAVLTWRRRLFDAAWFHRWAVAMGPLGFVALLAGWFVTEVGRQPFAVYGLMLTAEGASPIGAPGVGGSLLGFIGVYSSFSAPALTT